MQRKLHHYILAGSFAALTFTGAALAQSGASPIRTPSIPSPNTDHPSDPVGPAKDKVNQAKERGKKNADQSTSGSSNPNGTNSAGPISVTPPSQSDPTTGVGVNTDPAKANATAGPNGVDANASLNASKSTAKSTAEDAKNKLKGKKTDSNTPG